MVFAKAERLSQESYQNLALKVWKLDKLEQGYRDFLDHFEEYQQGKLPLFHKIRLEFEYLSLLDRDPFLPLELLPENWPGEKAHKAFQSLIKT